MRHEYDRHYDYSDVRADVKISLETKRQLQDYAESLCTKEDGFVSMKSVLDNILNGNRKTIEDYLIWLKDNKH